MTTPGLTRLLAPRSVAVVGATERPASYGCSTMRNLLDQGFAGRIVPINPGRDHVFGVATLPSLDALDESVDAVVVATPADTVPDVLTSAGRTGCGGAIVYAAEFAETGRHDRQDALVASAAAYGLPVIGPNANGLVSAPSRAALWGDTVTIGEPGPVAFVSQSGNLGVSGLAARRGMRLHTVVSVGNQAVVSAADVLAALPELGGVRSVAVYLEDDGHGAVVADALARCLDHGIRVAVLKAGRSAAGAAAGGAHTAAVAGDHRVFAALLEEAGGVVVDDLHQLFETAKALATPRPRAGGGLAVLTCSGGDSVVAADEAERLGVRLATFGPGTVQRLQDLLPPGTLVTNPLDHTNALWDEDEALRALSAAVTADPDVAQLLYVQDTPVDLPEEHAGEWRRTRESAVLGAAPDVPTAVASGLPELMPEHVSDELVTLGVLPLLGLPSALSALGARTGPEGSADRMRAISRCAAALPAGEPGAWLSEHEGKALLAAGGVAVPRSTVVQSADPGAVEAAVRGLQAPFAVKASHPDLQHKSDVGGVVLGVSDPADLRAAVAEVRSVLPGAAALVEEMADPGVELLVSVSRDGVVAHLVLGLGGIWTEVLADAVVVPLPVDESAVLHALDRLRGASLLTGGRGRRPLDRVAVARLAVAACEVLIAEDLWLVELNPVIVSASGAVAVDAVVRR